mmetsp:Transcript_44138/g.116810  ORF Transcript_44138/g.116810 Transcript_44138/m.116810 type:complete len:282 (+) Transcript_44138:905-1750(+)
MSPSKSVKTMSLAVGVGWAGALAGAAAGARFTGADGCNPCFGASGWEDTLLSLTPDAKKTGAGADGALEIVGGFTDCGALVGCGGGDGTAFKDLAVECTSVITEQAARWQCNWASRKLTKVPWSARWRSSSESGRERARVNTSRLTAVTCSAMIRSLASRIVKAASRNAGSMSIATSSSTRPQDACRTESMATTYCSMRSSNLFSWSSISPAAASTWCSSWRCMRCTPLIASLASSTPSFHWTLFNASLASCTLAVTLPTTSEKSRRGITTATSVLERSSS